jgi:hypothetical protein
MIDTLALAIIVATGLSLAAWTFGWLGTPSRRN